ncbi:MAG: hypothetical protein QOI66_4401, partial [Myxococcales bacterium]|nr:hypothetical protein [Myxococcales bacterium]
MTVHPGDDGGDANAGGDSGDSADADSPDAGGDSGDSAGAAAACGAIAAPNAWASWVMPNPLRSGLPNPASYTVSASGNQVSDNVTGLVWQRRIDS